MDGGLCNDPVKVSGGDSVTSTPSVKQKESVTAEQIILYGKRQSRSLHLEANVIAYFGQLVSSITGTTVGGSVTRPRVLRPLPK